MTAPHPVWNTVYGPKPHLQLSRAQYDLAAECARRAIEEPDATGLGKLVRLMAMGEAAELQVKSTLAGINPVLLADKANAPTLFALAGNARRLQGKVTSVGAVDAVRRLNECRPSNTPHVMEPKLLFEIRNEVLHMGLAPSGDDLEVALNELVTLVDSVFKIRRTLYLAADWGEFWSQKHLRIVEARQKAVYEQLVARFNEAIANAKVAYDRLIVGLGQDERNRLVAELMARQPEIDNEQTLRAHRCPACQNSLWAVYDVERQIQEDDSDAPIALASSPRSRPTSTPPSVRSAI